MEEHMFKKHRESPKNVLNSGGEAGIHLNGGLGHPKL